MNKMTVGVSLLVALLSAAVLTQCGGVHTRSVSASSVAALPANESLEVDLTQPGTVYQFEDPATDFSRVTVRTSQGQSSFAENLRASNVVARGPLILGRPEDLRTHLPLHETGGATAYDCGVMCKCEGTTDCMDLILAGKCGDDMWCSSVTNACYCTAKP